MNGLLRPLVWAAAAVIVITAVGIVIDVLWLDHAGGNAAVWLADLVRNIVLVALGFKAADTYQQQKHP